MVAMHNMQNRLGAVGSIFISILMSLALATALASYFFLPSQPSQKPTFKLNKAVLEPHAEHLRYALGDQNGPPRSPYIMLDFDMEFDLTDLFHYNTKEVFLYLTVEYGGKNYPRNSITVWDKIVMAQDMSTSFRSMDRKALQDAVDAEKDKTYVVKLKSQRNKYALNHMVTGLSDKLMDQEIKMVAHYFTMPYVGIMRTGSVEVMKGTMGAL